MSVASAKRPPLDAGGVIGLARSQYLELIRQPVFGVVLLAGTLVVALSPALAVFALGRAEALILDLSASAMLFFVVFLAATAVAAGSADRMADGTTAVVLTHPVSPSAILLGNLLGASVALAQASIVLTTALLWAVRNGPDAIHRAVVFPALAALVISLGWGVRASLARRAFQPAAIHAASLVFPLLYLFSLNVKYDLTWQAMEPIPGTALAAAYLAFLAALCFAALGGALATRLPAPATAILTLTAFLLASLVRGPLGPDSIGVASTLTYALPDLQLFWIGDAAYSHVPVPAGYLVELTFYTGLYAAGALGVGAFLLEGRELGR